MTKVPTYDQLMNPTIQALKLLGGSGTIDEIYTQVTELIDLTDEQLKQLHDPENGNQTEIEYRIAWSRTYLKKFGVLENPSRGIWGLTKTGMEINKVDPNVVKRYVKDEWRQNQLQGALANNVIERGLESDTDVEYESEDPSDDEWRQSQQDKELTNDVIERALEFDTGVEYEGEDLIDEVGGIDPFDPTLIRIDTRPMTVDQMMRRISYEEINLKPDFQRMGGIWNDVKQSRLIESMLLRIPLPAFYIDASDDDHWLVIDGLQRLTALRRFILDKTLQLRRLEFWQEYNGGGFDDLPRALQRRIEETQLTLYLVQEGTPHEVKFNIFKRINTGGVSLSGQEIRHALNLGPATDLLEELAKSSEFQSATDYSVSPMRMIDRECVLRFLAFKIKNYQEYTSRDDLDSFLNERMRKINQMGEEDPAALDILRNSFRRSMSAAGAILGNQAFRKIYPDRSRRSPVSKALFEAWSVNFDKLTDKEIEQLVKQRHVLIDKFIALMDDNEFIPAISYSTGTSRRVYYRFSRIEEIIRETLND